MWPCQGLGSLGLAGMFGLMAWWIHPWFLLGLAGQLGWSFWHAWRQAKRRAHDGSGFGFVDRFHVMILAWAQPVVRDWARIRGLVFGVRWNSLAQRNPAALGRLIPAGAAIRRQWWLEEWRDPLAEMATAVESAGGRVTGMSDPCSREDLSWDRVNWWAGAAAHVLEWHSDGTAVLRLKIRGWVSAKSLAPAAVVVAGAILLWMEGGLGRLGLGLAMAGGFVTAWLPAWLGRGRVARAMDAAAQRLGWRRIG